MLPLICTAASCLEKSLIDGSVKGQYATGKSLSQEPEMTQDAGNSKISRLWVLFGLTTGIRFLVDNGAQIPITLLPGLTNKKAFINLLLEAVNKSLIPTFGRKCFF